MNDERRLRALAVRRLNEALVAEIVRVHAGRGPRARSARQADLIAERIVRLGGAPDYSSLRGALRPRSRAPLRETAPA